MVSASGERTSTVFVSEPIADVSLSTMQLQFFIRSFRIALLRGSCDSRAKPTTQRWPFWPPSSASTSEVSVSVTIDQTTHLDAIMSELREFAELEDPDMNQVIICIVGNFWADKEGIAIKVLDAIKSIPIRMISYGASEHNISLLVDAKHKNDALNALNDGLFNK
jgi:hypothetical protein